MHGNEFHLFLPAIKCTRTSAINISVRISLTALGKFLFCIDEVLTYNFVCTGQKAGNITMMDVVFCMMCHVGWSRDPFGCVINTYNYGQFPALHS